MKKITFNALSQQMNMNNQLMFLNIGVNPMIMPNVDMNPMIPNIVIEPIYNIIKVTLYDCFN